jgi:hypothetical protein
MAGELKRIDIQGGQKTFEANGRTYHIEVGMCSERLAEYQCLEIEVGFSVSFNQFFNHLGEMRTQLNQLHLVEGFVILDNLQRGIANLEAKRNAVMRMCTMFINETDEDRSKYSEDMIARKIADWQEYDVRDFFTLALNMVEGFMHNYINVSRIISAQDKKGNQDLKGDLPKNPKYNT